MYCITSVFINIVHKHRMLLLEVDSISKQFKSENLIKTIWWLKIQNAQCVKQYCNTNKLKNTVLIQENKKKDTPFPN
jgi:hypothetical protein